MALSVMVTGARPKDLFGYDDKAPYDVLCTNLFVLAESLLGSVEGPVTFVSGGAQGADQSFFWAIDALKRAHPERSIENVVMVPFSQQASRWKEHGLFGQRYYQSMLDAADRVETVSVLEDPSSKGEAARAMHARNEAMVQASDVCVAVYAHDGPWQRAKGGTADAMRRAHRRGMSVYRTDARGCLVEVIAPIAPKDDWNDDESPF